ncbi:hypothetical protein [Streptomyces sp. NPDC021096]|uniref:hypothetical protein n=1 Tax=Streptomyces sp. NPDC021096 TaxID=3154792 RepID=UPI0033EEB743
MAARANLFKLACQTTEDGTGADEAYLNFNGGRIWGPVDINDGQERRIDFARNFTGQCTVDLFDEDSPDADDWLGGIVITESERGLGTRVQAFTQDDAHYTIFYAVTEAIIEPIAE